jgi:hypothetical protein
MRVSKREHLKKCIEWKMKKKMAFSHMLERRGLLWGGGVAIYSLGEWCTKVSVTLSLSAEWSFSAKYRKIR